MSRKLFITSIITGSFLLLISLSFLWNMTHQKNEDTDDLNIVPLNVANGQDGRDYDSFMVENVSILTKKNNKTFLSLNADEIVHRKRCSKLFFYQNVKEIYLSGVHIDIYPTHKQSDTGIVIPVDELNTTLAFFGNKPTSFKEYDQGMVADSDLDLLSRIFMENVSINIHYSDRKNIYIAAANALIHYDPNNIVFTGNVKITDRGNRTMYAKKAVWSTKYNGIYFPEGYTLGKSQHRNKSFYALNREGDFSRLWDIPVIAYADYLDIVENKLYVQVMKKLPPYAKMMLGLPLQ